MSKITTDLNDFFKKVCNLARELGFRTKERCG